MSWHTTTKSLLKDNSWIKKEEEEDEDVDRDPNFGRSVLSGRYTRTTETVASPEPVQTRTSTSSVQALTKRFSTSQDELDEITSPTRTYTRNTYSATSPKSTTTTTITENGKTTVTTTTQKSSTSTKTDAFMDRVFSDRTKGSPYSSYSPTRKTTVTETTVSTSKEPEDKLYDTTDSKTSVTKTETVIVKSSGDDVEDKLYDTLIPSSITNDSQTITTTEIVTVKSSSDLSDLKSSTTTRTSTSSMAEDQLYDTLIPKAISNPSTPTSSSIKKREYSVTSSGADSPTLTSTTRTSSYSSYTDEYPSSRTSTYTISTKTSDDISSDTRNYSYSKPDTSYEYSSITSPSSYSSTTYKTTRSDDIDTYSTRSSVKSVYASPERTVLEKDLCTTCRKPFTGDAKMILDDMKINCHATCFNCAVCNGGLGHLKAGDSLWVYKHMVHCERCFEVTRDKWRR